jgi:hypothetical protein
VVPGAVQVVAAVALQDAGRPLAARMAAVLPGEAQLSAVAVVSSALEPLTVGAQLPALARPMGQLLVALHVAAQRSAALALSGAPGVLVAALAQLALASTRPVGQLLVALRVAAQRSAALALSDAPAVLVAALAQLALASAQPVGQSLVALHVAAQRSVAPVMSDAPAAVWAVLVPAVVVSLHRLVVFQIEARLPVCAGRCDHGQGQP